MGQKKGEILKKGILIPIVYAVMAIVSIYGAITKRDQLPLMIIFIVLAIVAFLASIKTYNERNNRIELYQYGIKIYTGQKTKEILYEDIKDIEINKRIFSTSSKYSVLIKTAEDKTSINVNMVSTQFAVFLKEVSDKGELTNSLEREHERLLKMMGY